MHMYMKLNSPQLWKHLLTSQPPWGPNHTRNMSQYPNKQKSITSTTNIHVHAMKIHVYCGCTCTYMYIYMQCMIIDTYVLVMHANNTWITTTQEYWEDKSHPWTWENVKHVHVCLTLIWSWTECFDLKKWATLSIKKKINS